MRYLTSPPPGIRSAQDSRKQRKESFWNKEEWNLFSAATAILVVDGIFCLGGGGEERRAEGGFGEFEVMGFGAERGAGVCLEVEGTCVCVVGMGMGEVVEGTWIE